MRTVAPSRWWNPEGSLLNGVGSTRHTCGVQLILGTAQWGSGYGITRGTHAINDHEVDQIMRAAISGGIRAVDTHRAQSAEQGYGDAQTQLRPWAKDLAITTKAYGSSQVPISIEQQIRRALAELDIEQLHAVLVHDWFRLTEREQGIAAEALMRCAEAGLVRRVGVSGYDLDDVVSAQQHFASLGALQLPASPIDQRIIFDRALMELTEGGVEVHIRGIFAQGLLLPHEAPTRFDDHPGIQRFNRWCEANGLTGLQACIAFARNLPFDGVVVGVTSAEELREILEAWERPSAVNDWMEVSCDDLDLIDPRRWR